MPFSAPAERDHPARQAMIRHPLPAAGPTYDDYPRPEAFGDEFGAEAFGAALVASNTGGRPLSMDLALPYCRQGCWHCERRVITGDGQVPDAYLARLDREMVLLRQWLDPRRRLQALHWGGGTPTLLGLDQMGELIDRLAARFPLETGRDRDFAIEIDAREADVFTLRHLEALGFNRLTLPLIDLAPRVQAAINRPQPRQLTEPLLDEADRLGFRSLTLELVIGLPYQTRASIAETVGQVIALAPPRIRLVSYRHRPERHPGQRHIPPATLPLPAETHQMLVEADARLVTAGYVHLGREHYARRGAAQDDALRQAQREAARDRLGLGVGAVSRLPDACARNARDLDGYAAALDAGRLATASGRRLTEEDRLRRQAIAMLYGDRMLDLDALDRELGIDAERRLAGALSRLEGPACAELIERRGRRLVVTPAGRWRLDELAGVLDAYRLPPGGTS
ncbi:radical SAM protein [Halomonas organivorans]